MDYIKIRFVDSAEDVETEFRRTVEEILRAAQPRFTLSRQRWRPLIDIHETRKEIVITAEIAGVPREEINLEISPLGVKISGAREGGLPETDARYLLAEMPRGHFERNLTLSVPIDMENIKAVYRDGILVIRLSKRPLDRVHKINVHGS